QWVDALGKLQSSLLPCSAVDGHIRPGYSRSCPWCEIEQAGGPSYFEGVAGGAEFRFDNASLEGLASRYHRASAVNYSTGMRGYRPTSAIYTEPLPENVQTMVTLARIVGLVAILSPILLLGGVFSYALPLIGLASTVVFGGFWAAVRYLSPLGNEWAR